MCVMNNRTKLRYKDFILYVRKWFVIFQLIVFARRQVGTVKVVTFPRERTEFIKFTRTTISNLQNNI